MGPARDQLLRSSPSDVPIGPSDARDDSAAEIAALEQRTRDSLAVLQAHLGSLTLPDVHSDPYTRSGEWRPFDRNDYIRLVRRGHRPTHALTQALACGGSWLLSGLAVAPLGLLLAGLEPGGRGGDPVLLEAVHIFDEPAAAFLGSIAEAGEATLTAAPALADPLAVRAAEPDDRSAIEGARPGAAVSVAFAAPVARAADEPHPTVAPAFSDAPAAGAVAPAFSGAPAARAVAPGGMSSIEMVRPEPTVLLAFAGRVASAATHSHTTIAPSIAGSVAAPFVAPDRGTALASARVELARSLASPAPVATAVDALATAPVLPGSTTARLAEPDRSNGTEGAPALPPALVAVVAQTATHEESQLGVPLARVSPRAARAVGADNGIALESARPEPAAAGASTRLVAGLVSESRPTVTPARVGSAAAPVTSPDAESRVESGRTKLAVSSDLAGPRAAVRESHPVLLPKLEHRIALTAEPTVSPLIPVTGVGRLAAPAKPRMDNVTAVSDVVVLPALASFDAPIGDHDRLIAIASRGRDAVAGPEPGSGAAPVAEEPKLTSGRHDPSRDRAHDLELAARSGPVGSVEAAPAHTIDQAPDGTPVTLRADLTSPRLLTEEVALPPELVLRQGETAIRLASGLSSTALPPGLYEALIEWGGAQLPIAPLIVGNEPVEIAFWIEPSTVTLRFDGVADERVLWTIRRSEGGTLRLRGPVVSESLPPGDDTIEAEVEGELHRHALKVGVGEALTLVAR